MSADELIEKLNRINLIDEAAEGVVQAKDKIIFLNQSQLLEGKKADDSTMGTYRPFTIAKRQEKGRQTSFVDLFYEGDFQNAFQVRVNGDQYEIYSTDGKSEELQDKYGDNIFGLSIENRVRAWNEFIHDVVVLNIARKYNLATVTI